MAGTKFARALVDAIDKSKILGIRAGGGRHRFIGVWPVVVAGRVFVRAYYVKPTSWHFAFRKDRRGAMQVGSKTVPVVAAFTRSERVRSVVDRAYLTKYSTPWARKIARGFKRAKSRDTTTELTPASRLRR